jgi:hypothetical protein
MKQRLPGLIALIVWWAVAATTVSYVSGAISFPNPAEIRFIGFHQPPESLDGRAASLARDYSKIELPDPGWRPLRVTLELHAPPEAGSTPASVSLGVLDAVYTRVEVGPEWTSTDVVIPDPPTGRRLDLQVRSSVHGEDKHGVGVRVVRQTVVLVSREAARIAVAGLLVGLVPWILTSRARRTSLPRLARAVVSHSGDFARGLLLLAPGFAPVLWLGTDAAFLWWLWVSVLALAALGRLVRVSSARWIDASFPLYRDAVFELTLGLSSAVAGLYLLSFIVKRAARHEQPLESLFPLVFVGALLFGWTTVAARRRAAQPAERSPAGANGLIWSAADGLKLVAFFVVVVALGGPHLIMVHGYSTDPLQHIAWTNQVRLHGFVPDSYADTTLLIGYPLGFAAYAYVMTALTLLPPAIGVNGLPVLASATFIYLVVYGTRALQRRSDLPDAPARPVMDFLVFVGLATALSSAQFGVWHYYEGTGRSSTALVHAIPLVLLLDALYRWQQWKESTAHGVLARLCLLLFSGILLLQINPSHMIFHGLLSMTVLLIETAGLVRRPPSVTFSAVFGTATIVGLAVAVLLADPYWLRLAGARVGLSGLEDAHIRKVESDFLQRFPDRACLTLECIMRALERAPKTESLVYPFKVVVAAPAVAVAGQLQRKPLDSAAINVASSGFPAPVHGITPHLLLLLPLMFVLCLPRCSRSFLAFVAILLALAGIDLTIRIALGLLVSPAVPVLRLLPDYTARGSSVFFNQAVWAAIASGVYFALARAARASRRWALVLAVWWVGLAAAGMSSIADLRAEEARVRITVGGRLTVQDVRDLRAAERDVPADEAYLVASSAVLVGNEHWIDPLLDEAASLYAQANRPTLFLFFQSHGSQYSAADLESVCDQIRRGEKYPQTITRHNARWMVELSSAEPEHSIPEKVVCGRRVSELFPQYKAVARTGRLMLYRLW